MALHRDDQAVGRFNRLNRAIVVSGCWNEPGGKLAYRLVMEAVDADLVIAGGATQL